MYDYDDYDYEPTPYDTEIFLKDYETVSGETYEAEVRVDTWQIQAGNYSSRAADPDEYYGVYKTTYEILDVIYYPNPETEEGIYLSESELPKDILEAIKYDFEE